LTALEEKWKDDDAPLVIFNGLGVATFFSIIPFAIVLWFIISRYIPDIEEEYLTHREEEGQITTQGRSKEDTVLAAVK
jgi:hypothetical protein